MFESLLKKNNITLSNTEKVFYSYIVVNISIMIKHLFHFLKVSPIIFISILLFSCNKETQVINHNIHVVDEQLEDDFFECQESNDIDIVIIEDGAPILP